MRAVCQLPPTDELAVEEGARRKLHDFISHQPAKGPEGKECHTQIVTTVTRLFPTCQKEP